VIVPGTSTPNVKVRLISSFMFPSVPSLPHRRFNREPLAYSTNMNQYIFLLFLVSICFALPDALIRSGDVVRSGSAITFVDETALLTNAERMEAGLGPLKPKSLFDPTRVLGMYRASSSTVNMT